MMVRRAPQRLQRSDSVFWAKRLWKSKVFLLLSSALIVVFLVALSKEIARRVEVNQEVTSLQDEITQLESRNAELDQLIAYLNTDARYEKEARIRLGLQKPGESVLVVPEQETAAAAAALAETADDAGAYADVGNPRRWWYYFFPDASMNNNSSDQRS